MRPLELFGGVGAGVHFLNRSAGIAGVVARSEQTKAALHLLAGVDFTVSSTLNLFGSVRRDRFRAEADNSTPDQTKFYGGLRFKF